MNRYADTRWCGVNLVMQHAVCSELTIMVNLVHCVPGLVVLIKRKKVTLDWI